MHFGGAQRQELSVMDALPGLMETTTRLAYSAIELITLCNALDCSESVKSTLITS